MGDCAVDDVLKTIPDDMILSESSQPWIKKLLEAVNNAIVELEVDQECLSMSATGKALRDALKALPASKQIAILNDCIVSFGKRKRREADRIEEEEHQQEMADRRLKHDLVKYGAIVFMFLITVFVLGVIVISWKQDTAPDTEIASGLFSTLVQILKLIFCSLLTEGYL